MNVSVQSAHRQAREQPNEQVDEGGERLCDEHKCNENKFSSLPSNATKGEGDKNVQ